MNVILLDLLMKIHEIISKIFLGLSLINRAISVSSSIKFIYIILTYLTINE